MRYLVFRLYGPMASWGAPAVGETRPSDGWPGRSALVGLLGAALGIDRHDEVEQSRLRDSVLIAVHQQAAGVILRDYHTTQVPPQVRGLRHYTRREELAVPVSDLHTILSTREYRCDGCWSVAVRLREAAPWTLEGLAEALRRPRFPLYLGRRSCPPAAPLAPAVVEAGGIREALRFDPGPLTPDEVDDTARRLRLGRGAAYAWEGDGGDVEEREVRFVADEFLHRGRWQFTTRAVKWAPAPEDS